ncbi:hypothetical protein BBJ28_00000607 [Nothophytophthora sp. Chile5]|nr:hypothetical protein BBJ28_00000607 [Nothophytophthora sp. Chile5]
MLDPMTGGVVQFGEPMDLSAAREAEEEMGVKDVELRFLSSFYYGDERSRVWGGLFDCTFDGPLVLQEEEVAEVLEMSADEILKRRDEFTPDGIFAFEKYLNEQSERRSAGGRAYAATAASAMTMWTRLGAAVSQHTAADAQAASTAPAARSGHAMTLLSPTNSLLVFGGADGKVFFEDMYLLEPAQYADTSASRFQRTSSSSGRSNSGSQQAAGEAQAPDSLRWKRLVISHAAARAPSARSPLFSPVSSNAASLGTPAASQRGQIATLLHPGCGRDYHTMHYVQCSSEEERAHGMRVLVVGNVVVATDEAMMDHGGGGTQSESGSAGNATQTFDMPKLRVEELRVRQPTLEAQWTTRRVDAESMWKPRARHAHSSVVVGGEQLFVFGGKNATSSTFFNDLFYYDVLLNQWVQPAGNATGQPPQPRAFAGLTASDDGKMLFLFGGTDGKQEFGSLFAYDVAHARWDCLAGATLGDKPLCRSSHSLSFAAPHHLVLFGGRRRAARQNELFLYDMVKLSAAPSDSSANQPSRSNDQQQAIPTSNVLTDITNQSTSSSQQQVMVPQASTATTTSGAEAPSQSAVTKNKRRRLANDSQDSSNSNGNSSLGSVGSGDFAAAQVGIQTTLLQLLQHQPRLEDGLARVLAMLTKEQTARQQQGLDHETVMRLHSEEQSKRLDAATRRNEALEGRLARAEADRAALHAKLMARETELYMHKQSLEAALPPLGERVQAIEASHMQQLTVARVIESKISTVHDILDELRHAGGENTESDDSPHKHLGYAALYVFLPLAASSNRSRDG